MPIFTFISLKKAEIQKMFLLTLNGYHYRNPIRQLNLIK